MRLPSTTTYRRSIALTVTEDATDADPASYDAATATALGITTTGHSAFSTTCGAVRLLIIDASRPGRGSPMTSRCASARRGQQRVDLAAVHDDALDVRVRRRARAARTRATARSASRP